MNNLTANIKSAKFNAVVPFNASADKLLLMNFTDSNKELTPEITGDIKTLSQYINNKLETTDSLYGIGGYNEHRTLYAGSKHFDAGEEPRRLH